MANPRIIDSMVGIFLGAYWLGYLRLARRAFEFITQFAVQPITSVALSTFSRLQHDQAALTRAYLRMTQVVAFVVVPVFAGLALTASEFVPLVFGEKWRPSVLLLQLFAVMSLTSPISYFFAPTLNAVGATSVVLRQGILQLLMTVVFTAIAAPFGIVAIVVAQIIRGLLVNAYNLAALKRNVGFSPQVLLIRLLPIGAGIAGMIVLVTILKIALPIKGWTFVVTSALCGAATYIGVLVAGDYLRYWPDYMSQLLQTIAEAIGKPPWKRV
jgi:O-antigen/teichoic acid export membrane protein